MALLCLENIEATLSENIKNKPDSTNKKSLLEEYEDSLGQVGNVLPPDAEAILDALMEDEQFNVEIEGLIKKLTEESLDLAELQSKFILMIIETLKRLKKSKLHDLEYSKQKEQDISEQLALISNHLMMHKSLIAKESVDGLDTPKDRYQNITDSSKKYMKQSLRRFAIYEIYKWMNPHRIAGETRKDNFVHNMITGGIKKAVQYEGGTKEEIKSYSPSFIKSLEKKHEQFVKGGGRGFL
jgi:hypothetical protein